LAFSTVFPECIHLLCSLHKRENILRKLREFKVEEAGTKELLNDIFGFEIHGNRIEGLIDAKGCLKLELSKPKWKIICKEFPQWFTVREADLFCSSMIASVQCLAGLGNPPEYYATNYNESLNNFLKKMVDLNRGKWPKFNEVLFAALREQQEEFAKAVFSQGEYEFCDEYDHLQVTHLDWIQMNKEQREFKIKKAQKAKRGCAKQNVIESSSIQMHKHLSVSIEDALIPHVKYKTCGEKEKSC